MIHHMRLSVVVALGTLPKIGFGRRGLLERGLFRKVHSLEILENFRVYGKGGLGLRGV